MAKLKWETLSSEYIIKQPWATMRRDTCKMPDGRIVDDYYVLEYPDWANAVAITEDNEVLLVKQYRHAANEVLLEIPGGVIDAGEDPKTAMQRELLEETGYHFDDIEPISTMYPNPSTGTNICHAFLAKGGKLVQGQKLDEHEEIIVEKVSIPELKELLAANKFGQALHISSIFYALIKLGEVKL
ncbi:NUDIX hydrolase [Mucilaginibacter arboris]|uniref:GDP-mannose pyrophosphatase n=1 Tax=Mucilaginibacter arboris TaxID=2682090 RepID=A0A7K1T1V8_9SPHI|nr:NUDIX hydrolase [Mucilaginibacter arboris]MVN23507.1 NUDIX domain-containing protein [Mucilaginibacter arboris]